MSSSSHSRGMSASRAQTEPKATAEKSSSLVSSFKKAVSRIISNNSEKKRKCKEKPRCKEEIVDLMSSGGVGDDDEADWAFVYHQVLADCIPRERMRPPASKEDREANAPEDRGFSSLRHYDQ
ncbi:hypothetical protein FLONG3_7897 [Fusarium longipes]|uniref:Uncharacterized protein n=1 Tax=Fusarium longipes TaxID=694270 RepID=A0A395SA21_9HYPO|nr:hypothetical protein FLONG3_7897 [Fusarium longipes]